MRATAIIAIAIAAATAHAQQVDPGWDRREEYIAQTGDANCVYDSVIAWEKANPKPEVRERSLQFIGPARVEVSATDGHVYGIEVDPAGGEVIPVQRESTRLTHAQYEAARDAIFAARKATRDTAKAELDALKAKLATAEAEVAALKTKAATAEADMAAMKVDLDKLKAGKP